MADRSSPSAVDSGARPDDTGAVRRVVVCMKWVPLRPDVDPLTGATTADDRWSGPSPADLAALEVGLQIAIARGVELTAVTVGPSAAEAMLRDALAVGAQTAVRVSPGSSSHPPGSRWVAAALAAVVVQGSTADCGLGNAIVVCGDWSLDRGSGSVPPFLAAELGLPMACGLVRVAVDGNGDGHGVITADRRLDGGRRQRVRIDGASVLSVEGSAAHLRRAPLSGVLAAGRAVIRVATAPDVAESHVAPGRVQPYRPRTRLLDGPPSSGSPLERIADLTGSAVDRKPPSLVVLNPTDAADRIMDQLVDWGYVAASTKSDDN